jgi:hypothetical protein
MGKIKSLLLSAVFAKFAKLGILKFYVFEIDV